MEGEAGRATGGGFDARAAGFDRRSAPDAAAAERIAGAVLAAGGEAAGGATGGGAGTVLDLGAGTGALGAALAGGCAAAGRRYLGFDLSLAMLARFHHRLGAAVPAGAPAWLLRTDATGRWPLAAASAGTLFAARVVHLLAADAAAAERLAGEIRRVVVSGGVALLGTVRHDPESPRARLRRRLHELLAEHGFTARDADRGHRALSEALTAAGAATAGPPRVVATWSVREAPAAAVAGWRRRGHLAGRDVPEPLRTELLDELERQALEGLAAGRYDAAGAQGRSASESIERFEITTIRLGVEHRA